MGASSVTGVGLGAAEKLGIKGPGNLRNEFVPQVCPHVVAAGTGLIKTNACAVAFPEPLALSKTHYVVMWSSEAATLASPYVTKNDTDSKFSDFVITGTAADNTVIDWIVVTAGWGLAS